MKKLLILVALIISLVCQAQKNSLCEERGHVKGESFSSILLDCEPYIIDDRDTTWIIYPPCIKMRYKCLRCGEIIQEQGEETKKILWIRPKIIYEIYCDTCDFFLKMNKIDFDKKYNELIDYLYDLPSDATIRVRDPYGLVRYVREKFNPFMKNH